MGPTSEGNHRLKWSHTPPFSLPLFHTRPHTSASPSPSSNQKKVSLFLFNFLKLINSESKKINHRFRGWRSSQFLIYHFRYTQSFNFLQKKIISFRWNHFISCRLLFEFVFIDFRSWLLFNVELIDYYWAIFFSFDEFYFWCKLIEKCAFLILYVVNWLRTGVKLRRIYSSIEI